MPAESKSDPQLEIGHVLAIDIVGYSKLLIHEQSELQQRLNEIVRSTEQFRAADAQGKLIRLPTGDGMALVFFGDPKAPIECASEISAALKNYLHIQLRMGIHSGPVNEVLDVNERTNVAGAGIDIAQRVMDCGDAGHILLSKRVADDLAPYARWNAHLHELGECEVKHGRKISLVNFYTDALGNPSVPQKFKQTNARADKVGPNVRSSRWMKVAWPAVGCLLIVATGISFVRYWQGRANWAPRNLVASSRSSLHEKIIAVLPFKPLLAASRDESLEIGMADTLITKLGSLRHIIVRPVSAVRRYAALEQDPIAAGREQGVDSVLDGSVQKSGERIRVTVRLLSVADGQQLWADKFEEKFTDIFSVQDSISERVAAALAVTLTGADKKQLTKRYTESAEAYQLYLQGRYYATKYTPEATKKAIASFDKAIALDPKYALAYDGLAYCYYASDWFMSPKEAFAKAKALAQKALEIDPALAEAHISLGLLKAWADYDWPGAEREFKRAFELNPNYPPAHLWYGFYLMSFGKVDESIVGIKRAIELDPLSSEANTCLGIALLFGRRYDEALQQLRTTVEAEPDYWIAHLYFARALEKKGELSAAIAELKKTRLIEGAPAEVTSALGYAYAVSGNKAEAEKIILQLKEESQQFYVPAYSIATIYAGLGDKERAFEYLEKEYANGAYYLNYLRVDPELDGLRSDPRFADLLRRLRLAL
jgi:TolB-like protein/Flp pilus assembly protein TadD